jgi:hypothetical protein
MSVNLFYFANLTTMMLTLVLTRPILAVLAGWLLREDPTVLLRSQE